jgi:ABC-2 type transport system permease protein
MFLSVAAKYLKLTWEIKKIHLLSAMEYRMSFVLQIFFSVITHAAFLLLWILFFKKVPMVGGWQLKDTATLIGVAWFGDGLVGIILGGAHYLARIIALGELDYFLLLPHNLLWHISVSRTDLHSYGVLIVALVNFCLFGDFSWPRLVLFIIMSIISAAILFNFILITQAISFYVGNFEQAANKLLSALYGLVYYPYNVFSGILRFIAVMVIPAYFVGAVPAQLVHNFNIYGLLTLLIYWAATFVLGVVMFKRGLKRYESGSLIQVKL